MSETPRLATMCVGHTEVFGDELNLIRAAVKTLDIIGHAKGTMIATMGCSSDDGFRMLSTKSQADNRKVPDVASETVEKAQRRR